MYHRGTHSLLLSLGDHPLLLVCHYLTVSMYPIFLYHCDTHSSLLSLGDLPLLQVLVRAQRRLASVCDKRLTWLKEQYLKLYFEYETCSGPKPAEAIKVRLPRKRED